MTGNQYERLRHELEKSMRTASTLKVEQEQQNFVTDAFMGIHDAYKAKRVNHADYLKLVNRLAAYAGGAFNDYLDLLAGAAQVGMLEMAVKQSKQGNLADAARKRSEDVTDLIGMKPIKPEEESER